MPELNAAEAPRALTAKRAEERGQGICRTCLLPIWNEGGTIGHKARTQGWSDRIERGGDSLVCFSAREYRHVPLAGREAAIYDYAARLQPPSVTSQVLRDAAQAIREDPNSVENRADFEYPISAHDWLIERADRIEAGS